MCVCAVIHSAKNSIAKSVVDVAVNTLRSSPKREPLNQTQNLVVLRSLQPLRPKNVKHSKKRSVMSTATILIPKTSMTSRMANFALAASQSLRKNFTNSTNAILTLQITKSSTSLSNYLKTTPTSKNALSIFPSDYANIYTIWRYTKFPRMSRRTISLLVHSAFVNSFIF